MNGYPTTEDARIVKRAIEMALANASENVTILTKDNAVKEYPSSFFPREVMGLEYLHISRMLPVPQGTWLATLVSINKLPATSVVFQIDEFGRAAFAPVTGFTYEDLAEPASVS